MLLKGYLLHCDQPASTYVRVGCVANTYDLSVYKQIRSCRSVAGGKTLTAEPYVSSPRVGATFVKVRQD